GVRGDRRVDEHRGVEGGLVGLVVGQPVEGQLVDVLGKRGRQRVGGVEVVDRAALAGGGDGAAGGHAPAEARRPVVGEAGRRVVGGDRPAQGAGGAVAGVDAPAVGGPRLDRDDEGVVLGDGGLAVVDEQILAVVLGVEVDGGVPADPLQGLAGDRRQRRV